MFRQPSATISIRRPFPKQIRANRGAVDHLSNRFFFLSLKQPNSHYWKEDTETLFLSLNDWWSAVLRIVIPRFSQKKPAITKRTSCALRMLEHGVVAITTVEDFICFGFWICGAELLCCAPIWISCSRSHSTLASRWRSVRTPFNSIVSPFSLVWLELPFFLENSLHKLLNNTLAQGFYLSEI